MKKFLAVSLFLFPVITNAQSAQTLVNNIVVFLNVIAQFLIGVAFVFFVINAIRFFVIQGSNQDGREKARRLALYGVLAFVILIVFWGVVNLFASSLGLNTTCQSVVPDYLSRNSPSVMPCAPTQSNSPPVGSSPIVPGTNPAPNPSPSPAQPIAPAAPLPPAS